MAKTKTIVVRGTKISIIEIEKKDFISLTDMVKGFEEGSVLIEKWLRNKNTIEFIGIWEQINNPYFNSPNSGELEMRQESNWLFCQILKASMPCLSARK